MMTSFHQAAARHDIEIAVKHIELDGAPGFQVTRIQGGIRKLKLKANAMGKNVPVADVEAYYARQQRGRRSGVGYVGATDTPGQVADAPRAPSSPDPGPYDRATRLEQARRAAKEELKDV